MSARRKAPGEVSGTRKEHDAYDTDPACALACVQEALRISGGASKVLDPTAGMGPWVKAARTLCPSSRIAACDIRPECRVPCQVAGADYALVGDALQIHADGIRAFDLIATNPPFKLADALVRHFWPHMKPGAVLAFLLNITFLASTDRWRPEDDPEGPGLFTIAPLHCLLPIVPRPAFLVINGKKCSGMFEAGFFVWRKPRGNEHEVGETYMGARVPGPIRWKSEG